MRKIVRRIRGYMLTIVAAAVCLVWVSSVSAGENAEEWKAPARAAGKINPIPADEKSVAIGEAVYGRECLICHGNSGKGDGSEAVDLGLSLRSFTDPKFTQQTDGELNWKITEGNEPMPSFKKSLTEEERWHVVNYIRTFASKKEETVK